ncbi:MAG: hypothetical protein J1D77_08220 [Muribaculaceae bacterium]|nr:hypothetical protein [Muribaculaceae bacterium]
MKTLEEKEKVAQEIMEPENKFRGYTIEEIRLQRVFVSLEKDACKSRILRSVANLQEANPLMPGNKSSITGKAGALAMKMVSGLNYLDYILLGLSVFKGTRKIFSFFKGRKK